MTIFQLSEPFESSISHFIALVNDFLQHIPEPNLNEIITNHTNVQRLSDPFVVRGTQFFDAVGPYKQQENASTMLFESLAAACDGPENLDAFSNVLLAFAPKLADRQIPITPNIFNETIDAHHKSIGLRCFLGNYFKSNINEVGDQQIIVDSTHLIDALYTQSKEARDLFMYDT